jgi:O-antigen/teichoic acid export membrane protein
MTGINFARKIFSNTSYALLDQIVSKVVNTAAFVVAVRLLSSADIGTIGVGMGYLVILSYGNIDLFRILLRDYPKISRDRAIRDLHLSAYFIFWCIQSGILIVIALALQLFVLNHLMIPGLTFLFLGMTVELCAIVMQDWLKTVFYTELEQKTATIIGLFVSGGRLVALGALLLSPALYTYTWILVGTGVVGCIIWFIAFQIRFRVRFKFTTASMAILKNTLGTYAIWDHFNRNSIDTLLTIDILVLSVFGRMESIGNYAIAFKVTSLLFLIPWQLTRGLQIVIANCRTQNDRFEAINMFLKGNAMVGIAQLLFMIVGGGWLINVLFGAKVDMDVVRFTIVMSVGASIVNLGWPLCGVINNSQNLREAWMRVFLPALILGIGIYIGTASLWGALGLAYGKVAVYVIVVGLLYAFTKQYCPFPFNLYWITPREKEIIQGLVKSLR